MMAHESRMLTHAGNGEQSVFILFLFILSPHKAPVDWAKYAIISIQADMGLLYGNFSTFFALDVE
jgi:hypothetical protein